MTIAAKVFTGERLHIGRFYLATSGILLLGFVAYAVSTWFGVTRDTETELNYVDGLFRNAIESSFQHHESVLKILGQRLLEVDVQNHPERGRALVDELIEVNPAIAGFGMSEPNGQLLLVSGIEPGTPLPNLLEQSESMATFLQVFDTGRLVLGWTYYMPLLKKWLIPIRIAIRDDQGFIKLVSTAGLDIDADQAMWNAIDLPDDVQVTLLRNDGFVQLHLPTPTAERQSRYHDPAPDEFYTDDHQLLGQDPFNPGSVAVSSYLMDSTMRTFVSYPEGRLWKEFSSRLIMPSLLFAAAFLLTWVLYRSVLHNQRAFESQLLHQAHHDPLTKLPNRLLIADRLTNDLARARRFGKMVAVFYIDLDQFKRVNDSYGHKMGDILLNVCARRLEEVLREGDTVGRLGGDEFLLILPDLQSANDAEILASRVLGCFASPFMLEGQEIFSTASIGISLSPQDGDDTDALMQNADTALYKAKDEGRDCYFFYQQALNEEVARRIEVERELRKALEHKELRVVYQPQASLDSYRWKSAEALVRWNNPTLGAVSPVEFIPIAEEIGLINDIGKLVLRTALQDLKQIHQLEPEFGISVNTSVRQFRSDTFLQETLKLLEEAELPPDILELEVTESVLADGAEKFNGLREAGIRLAVDDFGTGFSSLSYLKQIPITTLKIDRAFVQDLETDLSDATLTKAIIALAKELGLDTIAEGVETQSQLDFLRSHGCNLAQGYLLAKPKPIDDLLVDLEIKKQKLEDKNLYLRSQGTG